MAASTPVASPSSTAATTPYPQSPVLEMPVAAAVLIANVIVPGLGTVIAGIVGKHPTIGRGILQFILAIIIVGWIWGIVTGVQCLINARK
jgi:hypothetical protein